MMKAYPVAAMLPTTLFNATACEVVVVMAALVWPLIRSIEPPTHVLNEDNGIWVS